MYITYAELKIHLNYILGGTLRIYADSLKPNIPYKTILLSTTDTSDFAVIEALEKYGLEKENPKDYCVACVSIINESGFGRVSLQKSQSASLLGK